MTERGGTDLVRALLETVHDAILVVDQGGRIEMTNERAERLFGYAPGQLVGRPVEELVPEHLRGAHERYTASYLAAPRPRPMGEGLDIRARRADGTEIPVEIALSTFEGPHGDRVSLTIRERTAPSLSRFTADYVDETSVDAARRLAQVVSHDMNNQLGVIFNATSLLLSDIPAGDPTRDDVNSIRIAAERASEITRRLASFASRQEARLGDVDVGQALTRIGRDTATTLPRGTTMVVDLATDLWHALADPVHLEEALEAMTQNAIEAMPTGGVITLQASNEDIAGSEPRLTGGLPTGPYVRITMTDSGVGMTSETATRAFDPFFTTKRGSDGAGLGLVRVSSTAKEARGIATLHSEPGVGTSVRMFLPAVARTARAEPAPAGRGETILLVEDDPTLRALTRLVLRRGGYLVLDAEDGLEALRIVSDTATHLDLLLLDLGLPRISGRELAIRVRHARPSLRVLYTSCYHTDVLLGRGEIEPGVMLLEKPYSEAMLLETIARALASAA